MARLVALLVTGQSEREATHYTPGSIVCLERMDADHWVIDWMLRPELVTGG